MESCAAIGNRRACRLPTGTQLAKLPHKRTVVRGQGTSRVGHALAQCHLLWTPATILHKLWGSQSWLQPAFSRPLPGAKTPASPEKPPKKAAAGKIACPTNNAESCNGQSKWHCALACLPQVL